jgi:hypothetical protein
MKQNIQIQLNAAYPVSHAEVFTVLTYEDVRCLFKEKSSSLNDDDK